MRKPQLLRKELLQATNLLFCFIKRSINILLHVQVAKQIKRLDSGRNAATVYYTITIFKTNPEKKKKVQVRISTNLRMLNLSVSIVLLSAVITILRE